MEKERTQKKDCSNRIRKKAEIIYRLNYESAPQKVEMYNLILKLSKNERNDWMVNILTQYVMLSEDVITKSLDIGVTSAVNSAGVLMMFEYLNKEK